MNTGNRILWIAIGFVVTGAGVVALLASLNRLSGVDADRRLITSTDADRWNGWGGWAFAVTIGAGVMVAAIGFLLVRAQLRGRGGTGVPTQVSWTTDLSTVDGVAVSGRTRVASSALNHALVRDLQADRQVKRAAVRLVGPERDPEVLVRLAVTADADLVRLHGHVNAALSRFTATSGLKPHLQEVSVRIDDQAPARVH